MSDIATKLAYLNDTKDLFKDRLNSLGAEIIESTTFRNYLNWLDTFYNQSSDKTDLSTNGVVGRTSQETTTGKNLFDKSLITSIGGTIKYIPINVKKNTDYTLSTNSGTSTLANVFLSTTNSGVTTNNNGAMIDQPRTINSGDNNIMYVGYRNDLSSYWIQLEEGSSATSYEPYTGGQPSPSPDYPQPINNLSGDVTYKVRGKNLLNLNLNKNVSRNGITYNVASDGTITINGTATAQTDIDYLNEALKTTANKKYYLEYIYISGSLTGTMNIFNQDSLHGWSGYNIDFSGADASQNRTNGKTYTTDMNMAGAKIIRISNGATLNNLKFKLQFTQSESVDYDYEPYISESFPLSLKSKNLFDKNNANIIKCGISYHKINASDSNRLLYISIQPNTTYTIQRRNDGNVNRFRAGACSIVPANGVDLDNAIEADNAESITITSRENDTYLAVMYYRTQETILTEQQILDSIQIEEGSTPTDYEPYYDIELCNISDYKDRIYSQNGEFYLEKKTVKAVLDGTETWNFGNAGATNINGASTIITDMMTSSYGNGYSNYFVNKKSGKDAYTIRFGANNNTLYFYVNNNEFSNVDIWKTWLSTHNTEVEYILATPTTTEITQENHPTLYSQLLAIQEFLTKYKINKEFLLNYSSPEIEY